MDFRVQLEAFRGPLDLLLFLVRQDEVDLGEIPVAAITSQYLAHLDASAATDVNDVGDFLETTSVLLEMKARRVLPSTEEADDQRIDDPHDELVRRLLDYKKYKDAAVILEEQSAAWRQRFARTADDFPARRVDPANQPLHEIELWDLVSALGRVMRDNQPTPAASIIYDDTPIVVHMQRICGRVAEQGGATFSEMFSAGMHKSTMIGLFLAILELVRKKRVRAEQEGLHAEIRILPDTAFHDPWGPLTDPENPAGEAAGATH